MFIAFKVYNLHERLQQTTVIQVKLALHMVFKCPIMGILQIFLLFLFWAFSEFV